MKMKTPGLLLLLLLQLTVYGQNRNDLPAFNLDDKHSQTQPEGSAVIPEKYKLSSRAGFKLNCLHYDFSLMRKLNGGKNPDAVFIVCKAGNYMAPLNTAGFTSIDKSTMKCLDEKGKIFPGFEKGDTPIMAIGTLEIKDQKAEMKSFWVAMLEVK